MSSLTRESIAGLVVGGLAVDPVQAEHSTARLAQAVRRCVIEKDILLQLGGRQAERRPRPHPRPQQGRPRLPSNPFRFRPIKKEE